MAFDDDLGMQQLDSFKQDFSGTKIKPDFTDFFPVIRHMGIFANGILVVGLTKSAYEYDTHSFDTMGKRDKTLHTEGLQRTVALRGKYSYIIFQDEKTEEYGVARVEEQDIETFFKANPRR
jgi:hypothetical protein